MEDKSKNLKLDLYNISEKTGYGKLGIYYSKKGKVKRFPSSVQCHKDSWDKKNKEVKKGGISETDRAIVYTIYNKVAKIITDHQFKYNELPAIEYIFQVLDKPNDLSENIHDLYAEFFNDYVKPLSPSKQETYKYVGEFLLEVDKRNKYNLNLHNFNYSFIQKFKTYLLEERGNQNSTVNLRIADLITFVNWLNRKEIKHSIKTELWQKMDNNSVEDFTCLERKELEAILMYNPEKTKNLIKRKREQRTKDMIIFLSHTGMRVGDMKRINHNSVCMVDNIECLKYVPQKTKRKKIVAIVPITKPVREILEKYDYKPKAYNERFVVQNIRKLCEKINILKEPILYTKLVDNEPVTEMVPKYSILDSHAVGRKTFINLCIERKVQLTTIAGMSGHKKIDTILKYYADKHANKQTALSEVFEM